MDSIIFELEGTLLKNRDSFAYFMLVAFEASGLLRFSLLLLMWPVIWLLEAINLKDSALRLATFIAMAGLRESEINWVARAVLPKFFMDDIDMKAWRRYSGSYRKRIVVTRMPRIMVERFVKEHLQAHEVIGAEMVMNRFGFATGLVRNGPGATTQNSTNNSNILVRPVPVIFHDGRLVMRPTPTIALVIILWLPLGILLAIIRILIGFVLPLSVVPYVSRIFTGKVIVKGKPPPRIGTAGVLFVCTHRTLMDPVVLSTVLRRKVPAVTYSISRLSEILSPIPTLRLTRTRQVDADMIKRELAKGDLAVFPEGTTCREPFLLRFSALFAELTDRIVPVAMNYRVGFLHATTARGWKGLHPVFFFMNPWPEYEVTFLNQLPVEATCSAGRSPHDVANYVQRILAAALGFECTNFTRKDKYRLLAGNDGNVSLTPRPYGDILKKLADAFKPFIH